MKDNDFLKKVQNLNSPSNSQYDLEKIIKVLNNINIKSEKNEIEKSENNSFSINFENNNLKTIKSILPLLEIKNESNVKNLIEFIEINHILTQYKNTKSTKNIEKTKLKKETLLAIKNKLSEENKELIDFALKAFELNEIKNKIILRKG